MDSQFPFNFRSIAAAFLAMTLTPMPAVSSPHACLESFETTSPARARSLQLEQPSFDQYRKLLALAKPYSDAKAMGRLFPPVAQHLLPRGRALLTEDLTPDILPAPAEPRPSSFDRGRYEFEIRRVPHADLLEVSDIVLWTRKATKAPANSLARLGVLRNGQPVAVITHTGEHSIAQGIQPPFVERVASAILLSDLGIGPRFYGRFVLGEEKAMWSNSCRAHLSWTKRRPSRRCGTAR